MSKIVIVGGGVVGLFTAWYLRKSGADVVVVDRGDFTDGVITSYSIHYTKLYDI